MNIYLYEVYAAAERRTLGNWGMLILSMQCLSALVLQGALLQQGRTEVLVESC